MKEKGSIENYFSEFDNLKDYYIEQITTTVCLQYSYYIESNGEAALIDPMRESEKFVSLTEKRDSKLKYIFETHYHEDYSSFQKYLANRYRAKIINGYKNISNFNDKLIRSPLEVIQLGKIKLKILYSITDNQEMTSFILLDSLNTTKYIFTGDFLFLSHAARAEIALGRRKILYNRDNVLHKLYIPIEEI